MSNAKLVLAGPKLVSGEEKYLESIKKCLDFNNIKYHFFYDLGNEELVSFYQSLDCLVLPSNNSTEAFGMVQIEAMNCGVPVVASDLPGIRSPIQKTQMGELFEKNNSIDLTNKIKKILKNRNNYLNKDLSGYKIKFFYQKWQELLIQE